MSQDEWLRQFTAVYGRQPSSEEFLRARYAVAGGDAYADFAVLRGDSSDGLPGVAGIGEKTAATLLATFGDLAGIRAAIDSGAALAKLEQLVTRTHALAGAAAPPQATLSPHLRVRPGRGGMRRRLWNA